MRKHFSQLQQDLGKMRRQFSQSLQGLGKIKLNQKGVFFSIVSVLIIVLFMTMTQLASDISSKESEIEVTRTRIKVLNSLIKDMEENYFEKMIYVSGKNSMKGLSKYYYDENWDIDKTLFKAMEDTIDDGILIDKFGSPIDLIATGYMKKKYTSNELIQNISELLEDMGIVVKKLEINITTGNISQENPWFIVIEADAIYDLRDKDGIVSWRGTSTKSVNISVIGLYAYDYEGRSRGNDQKITADWVVDEPSYYTENSMLTKLGEDRRQINPAGVTTIKEHGLGLCSPDYEVGLEDHTCKNDTQGDHG
ncbi:hypothetical protein HON49_02705 [archaeon]|jgi:hypothetical protein|nr:hypothetical protein [archaeon]